MPLEHRVLSAGDKVYRRRLSLAESGGAKNETLMSIYRHWESLRHEGQPPKRSAFDIQQLRPVMGMTCVVDVTAEHPDDYFVRLFGSDIPLGTDMSKHRLGDYPRSPIARCWRRTTRRRAISARRSITKSPRRSTTSGTATRG